MSDLVCSDLALFVVNSQFYIRSSCNILSNQLLHFLFIFLSYHKVIWACMRQTSKAQGFIIPGYFLWDDRCRNWQWGRWGTWRAAVLLAAIHLLIQRADITWEWGETYCTAYTSWELNLPVQTSCTSPGNGKLLNISLKITKAVHWPTLMKNSMVLCPWNK